MCVCERARGTESEKGRETVRGREGDFKEPTCVEKKKKHGLPEVSVAMETQQPQHSKGGGSEQAGEALPHVCSRTYRQFSMSKHRSASHLAHCSSSSPSAGRDVAPQLRPAARIKPIRSHFPGRKKKSWLINWLRRVTVRCDEVEMRREKQQGDDS